MNPLSLALKAKSNTDPYNVLASAKPYNILPTNQVSQQQFKSTLGQSTGMSKAPVVIPKDMKATPVKTPTVAQTAAPQVDNKDLLAEKQSHLATLQELLKAKQSQLSMLNGSPNNPSETTFGTRGVNQTQQQANVQANLPTYQGGQQISGQGGANYPGIVGQLVNTSQNISPNVSAATEGLLGIGGGDTAEVVKARKELADFQANAANQIYGIASAGMPLSEATGRQQALFNEYQAGLSAREQAVANALASQQQRTTAFTGAGNLGNTAQGLQQTGLTSAAGFAQPQLAQQGQAYYSPLTGGIAGGTGGGVNMTGVAANDVSNLANAVNSGTMDYATAISQLSGYGTAIQNQLLPAIQKINPNFNVAQSNVLATQQGQVAPALQNAALSLQSLKDSMQQLQIPGQTSSFTPLNTLTNWASQYLGWGKEQTAAVTGKVNEVRNSLQNALSLTGTNPNEATAQSYRLLPDNPSMDNVNAAISVLSELGAIKRQVYGTPGAAGLTGGTTGSSIYSW